jgi:diguanylate cyclase (GGDEF)-like protein
MAEAEPLERPHVAFMAILGLLGWIALGWASRALPVPPHGAELLSFTLFFAVIAGARVLAFRVLPETLVSLDSSFYVAAAVCLGTVQAGRLVATALTLDALLRLLGTDASGRRQPQKLGESLAYVLYYGGMTGGLLLGVGLLFDLDSRALQRAFGQENLVIAVVFGAGLVLLAAHYLIQGVRLVLAGTTPKLVWRRMALPGILAEASLLPLGVVVVLLYSPEYPLGFVLLGATYTLINFVFNRLARAGSSLRQRLAELETLNRSAHALGSSLEFAELLEITARETLAAIPEAELVAVALREGELGSDFIVDCYDREEGEFARVRARPGEGLSAVVVERGKPLSVADLRRGEYHVAGDDAGVRSWLGTPITRYEEIVGVLSVQSREPRAFGPNQQRVLEAIGAQAGTAIQNARLYELATVDGLTGLFVRRYFDGRLREELERARRYQTEFSVVLLDVDNFKKLNDTYGHGVGDRVLREVATVMRRNMRGVDIPARYGGEEFAFILPRTGMLDAHAVAERLRQDLSEARIAADDKVVRVTASLGLSSFPESGAESADEMVKLADTALYRAKQTGKNRVELYWRP